MPSSPPGVFFSGIALTVNPEIFAKSVKTCIRPENFATMRSFAKNKTFAKISELTVVRPRNWDEKHQFKQNQSVNNLLQKTSPKPMGGNSPNFTGIIPGCPLSNISIPCKILVA